MFHAPRPYRAREMAGNRIYCPLADLIHENGLKITKGLQYSRFHQGGFFQPWGGGEAPAWS